MKEPEENRRKIEDAEISRAGRIAKAFAVIATKSFAKSFD
jgi:hypothetical protein